MAAGHQAPLVLTVLKPLPMLKIGTKLRLVVPPIPNRASKRTLGTPAACSGYVCYDERRDSKHLGVFDIIIYLTRPDIQAIAARRHGPTLRTLPYMHWTYKVAMYDYASNGLLPLLLISVIWLYCVLRLAFVRHHHAFIRTIACPMLGSIILFPDSLCSDVLLETKRKLHSCDGR